MKTSFQRALHSLLLCSTIVAAASRWTFTDGTVIVSGGNGNGGSRESLSAGSSLEKHLVLGATETLKLQLTAEEAGSAKQPHQAFLLLRDPSTNLESNWPLMVKGNGKAKLDLAQKDLPIQLLLSERPLEATLVLASFGSSEGLSTKVFEVAIQRDANVPAPTYAMPLRYGKKEDIHHTFRADAQSPPRIVSAFFVLAVLATLPILGGTWLYLGVNADHLSNAMNTAPVSHAVYFGSILAMEGLFLLYYTSWNLLQVLPVALIISIATMLSGSKALSEVQGRRLAGLR